MSGYQEHSKIHKQENQWEEIVSSFISIENQLQNLYWQIVNYTEKIENSPEISQRD